LFADKNEVLSRRRSKRPSRRKFERASCSNIAVPAAHLSSRLAGLCFPESGSRKKKIAGRPPVSSSAHPTYRPFRPLACVEIGELTFGRQESFREESAKPFHMCCHRQVAVVGTLGSKGQHYVIPGSLRLRSAWINSRWSAASAMVGSQFVLTLHGVKATASKQPWL
jgi:hypothetical protein